MRVVETAKCGLYVMEDWGFYWAIRQLSDNHAYHRGSERYIRTRWNRHYKNVMYRQSKTGPSGLMEMYYENRIY